MRGSQGESTRSLSGFSQPLARKWFGDVARIGRVTQLRWQSLPVTPYSRAMPFLKIEFNLEALRKLAERGISSDEVTEIFQTTPVVWIENPTPRVDDSVGQRDISTTADTYTHVLIDPPRGRLVGPPGACSLNRGRPPVDERRLPSACNASRPRGASGRAKSARSER
jgi:hypothetical protein